MITIQEKKKRRVETFWSLYINKCVCATADVEVWYQLADEKRHIQFDYACPYRASSKNLRYVSMYEEKPGRLYYCRHRWLCKPYPVRRSCKPILRLDAHRKYIYYVWSHSNWETNIENFTRIGKEKEFDSTFFLFDSEFPHNNNHVFTFPFIKRRNSSPLKYYEQVTTMGNEEFSVILIYN